MTVGRIVAATGADWRALLDMPMPMFQALVDALTPEEK